MEKLIFFKPDEKNNRINNLKKSELYSRGSLLKDNKYLIFDDKYKSNVFFSLCWSIIVIFPKN